MDDAELRRRLWEGFAALQTLLGGNAREGFVIQRPGLVASIVPSAPDSPALNAAVAIKPRAAPEALADLEIRYGDAGVRRWAVWVDGGARDVTAELRDARPGDRVRLARDGRGDRRARDRPDHRERDRPNANLRTVGRVNDLAYGNVDSRLERTLTTLEEGTLRGYRADLNGAPAAVALALHHGRTAASRSWPRSRRRAATASRRRSCAPRSPTPRATSSTTITLQATELGERLYQQLGLRRLGPMELWEHRR